MADIYTDPTQTTCCSVDSVSTDGTAYTVEEAVIIQVVIPDHAAFLSGYVPSDPSSPSEAVCRQIARVVLDGLVAFTS